ncbi:MAG TPA: DEAD/DEAH box helicase [Marmoricola sp.]|nr:DEAD/DEAH box helicase [Marmoricola sp.]
MGIFDLYDDDELVRSFGSGTVARGREYVERRHILTLEISDANPRITVLNGRVNGSGGRVYGTSVTLVDDPSGPWLDARCTCPVVRMCKHAAALVIAATERRAALDTPARDWERRLGLVLEELDRTVEEERLPKRPLGLQVELATGRPASRWSAWQEEDRTHRGQLRVRPLQRGARDKWVKTQVSWLDVPNLGHRTDVDQAQAAVLVELLAAHRAANRQAYFGNESHLTFATYGPSVWPLLREAERVGLPLVPAGLLRGIRVATEPAVLRFDVNGADREVAQLEVGVTHEEEWYTGARLEVLGDSGHGVALWTPAGDGWEVVLAPLAKPAGTQTRRLVAAGHAVPVPKEDVPDLVAEYLPRLRRHLPVVSSDETVPVPELVEPRLALTVTWKAVDEVHLAWSWRYRVAGDDRIYALDETRGLRGIRRADAEQALLDALELDEEQLHRLFGAHRTVHGPIPEQTLTGPVVIAFLEETLLPLEASGQVEIEEIGARPSYTEVTEAPVIRFAPREDGDQRTDWLDLEVVITIGDRHVGLAQLLEALTLGAERIILRDGAHLRIDRPEFAQLAELVHAARELEEQPRDGVRVAKHDLGIWEELDEIGLVAAQASQWVRAARALTELEGLPDVHPVGLDAELRSYQLEGFRWLVMLWQSRLGGILADDMGLGKTMQTLALFAHARAHGSGPFLVVAPTSVVATWVHEAATFTPGLTVRAVTESRARRGAPLADVHQGADVVVTSYTLYRLETDEYAALDWGGLVLDEAQMVKNHTGKTHQSVRRLDVPFRLALTGTPMENRLMELWSLLSIVAPGLYPYPQRFTEAVANPVEREGDAEVLARFRRRIRPFLLRRTKELVASDLPPKQEQVLEVQLNPRHRRIYETHLQRERQNVLGLLGDFDKQRMAIFRSLTRLRQLSLDAALVDSEYDGVGSAKVDALVDHLLEVVAEGHRALVFSQFTSFLTRVRKRLDAEGIESRYLDGRTRRRAEEVGAFKAGAGAVFLISLKAGGVGLTLTEADYVFVLDPWWNPAVEAQAVDRAHRIGQERPVIVYRLVAAGTIEEKVMELKARKAALFAKVVDGGGGMGTPIGPDDVRALLEE